MSTQVRSPADELDQLIAEAAERLPATTAENGLPPDITPAVRAQLSARLAGVRSAFARWQAKPPLNPDEFDRLESELAIIVGDAINTALAPYLAARKNADWRAANRLDTWNRTRNVNRGPTWKEREQQRRAIEGGTGQVPLSRQFANAIDDPDRLI
jgi:hypothetical protein